MVQTGTLTLAEPNAPHQDALTSTAKVRRDQKLARFRVGMIAACPFPANHGTPGSIREMAEALVEEGHEVHILTYHFGEDIEVRGPRIHRIPRLTNETRIVVGPTVRRPFYDAQLVFTTLRVIRDKKLELLHAHGYEAALAAWLCRLVTGIPVVYSGHNTMEDELPTYGAIRPAFLAKGLAKLLDLSVPRLADRCLPHSVNIQRFFHDLGLSDRTDPVVNFGIKVPEAPCVDSQQMRVKYKLGNGPIILYSGVIDQFQRLDLLIDAMARIIERLPTARLLMVRTIPNDRQLQLLRHRVSRLGLEQQVVFTRRHRLPAVRQLLAACDVAVVPRPQTPGFPIKLLNYMAARKPAVLFSSSASGLTHRENAFLIDEDTSEALADGIQTLIKDERLRQRIADGGYAFVRMHHNRRSTARQVARCYGRTLDAAHRHVVRSSSMHPQCRP